MVLSANQLNYKKSKILIWCCRHEKLVIIESLLNAGADIHAKNDIALVIAVESGNIDMVLMELTKLLLSWYDDYLHALDNIWIRNKIRAYINTGNGKSFVASCKNNDVNMFSWLLSIGADINMFSWLCFGGIPDLLMWLKNELI